MLTNKEYVESRRAVPVSQGKDPYPGFRITCNCGSQRVTLVSDEGLTLYCLDCGQTTLLDHPPDPKPVVVIEVQGGVASVLKCPERVEVVIVDKDILTDWTEISRYHLAEMTDLGLTDLKIEAKRERGNIGETVALRILKLISEERERRDKDV